MSGEKRSLPLFWLYALVSVFLLLSFIAAESTSGCGCQPSEYQFKLDFSSNCLEDTDVNERNTVGIHRTECTVTLDKASGTTNVTDQYPVAINQIQIVELYGEQNEVTYKRQFKHGDTIRFQSMTSFDPNPSKMTSRGVKMTMKGFNSFDQLITNTWSMTYLNDCSIHPGLEVGQHIGWAILVSFLIFIVCMLDTYI